MYRKSWGDPVDIFFLEMCKINIFEFMKYGVHRCLGLGINLKLKHPTILTIIYFQTINSRMLNRKPYNPTNI